MHGGLGWIGIAGAVSSQCSQNSLWIPQNPDQDKTDWGKHAKQTICWFGKHTILHQTINISAFMRFACVFTPLHFCGVSFCHWSIIIGLQISLITRMSLFLAVIKSAGPVKLFIVYPSLQSESKEPSQLNGLRWLYRFRVIPSRHAANCH